MKKAGECGLAMLFIIFYLVLIGYPVLADDTCVFFVTSDELPLYVAPKQDTMKVSASDIFPRTETFTAPVVPAAKTISGDKIYMSFFKPGKGSSWEGSVTKYGISSHNQIVDVSGNPVERSSGVLKSDAVPYWATIDWADATKRNYIHHSTRNIYTYLTSLTSFEPGNANLTAAVLGSPLRSITDIIDYVRGADVLDEDGDGDVTENRSVITGDVLHSELTIFQYRYADRTSKTMVYFGANDGMLHAVLDVTERSGVPSTSISHGSEAWAVIPPDQLPRLKEMIEGVGHQSYVDATPKIYFKDMDEDGIVDAGDGDKVVLVCGLRKGGTAYFALDVTDPSFPQYLWRINQYNDSGHGWAAPRTVIAELGESWSEPQFGVVKTKNKDKTGTPVFFIGGGYSSNNSSGKAVIAVNVITGDVVKKFTAGMNYSVPSSVLVVDENDNGFVDKVYVGDLGGQIWRFGSFTDPSGNPLTFPNCNENIHSWEGHVLFKTDNNNSKKFFYPPSLTLEKGYDMVFMGTGDRENACCNNKDNVCGFTGPNIIAAVKDTHSLTTIVGETDLVDVTHPSAALPNLPFDQGWYIRLVDDNNNAVGEKVLAEGTVFYKTFYITTFTPSGNLDVPGGKSKLYALSYLTGASVLDFNGDSILESNSTIGEGIPSKPVVLITRTGTNLLISMESADPDAAGPGIRTGLKKIDPLLPPNNIFYRYWKEIF
jgi:type IV pilus assembly protein PilY1